MKTLLIYLMLLVWAAIASPTSSATGISDEEKEGIRLMREEEKLAHDVYAVLYEKWQLPVFNNISASENRHFEAVGFLLETYGIEDPAYAEAGKFRNNELAHLYDSLVSRGSESLVAALEVGAFIEETDIKDLQELIDSEPDETSAIVYGNLLRASHNHLRAFTGQLAFREGNYTPKVLNENVYQDIVSSEHQPGNGANCMTQNRMRPGKGRHKNRNCMNR